MTDYFKTTSLEITLKIFHRIINRALTRAVKNNNNKQHILDIVSSLAVMPNKIMEHAFIVNYILNSKIVHSSDISVRV